MKKTIHKTKHAMSKRDYKTVILILHTSYKSLYDSMVSLSRNYGSHAECIKDNHQEFNQHKARLKSLEALNIDAILNRIEIHLFETKQTLRNADGEDLYKKTFAMRQHCRNFYFMNEKI